MKSLLPILSILLTTAVHAMADDNFAKAQAAYDEGHYAEAALLYETMLSNGVENVEVHYNLANACFKDGDLPKAVSNYRQAWYDAPRDPDINANLHFALNAAGAIEPAAGLVNRILSDLSETEWIAVAAGGYVLLCALPMLALMVRPARRTLLRLCLVPLAMLALSACGWREWRQYQRYPEGVVVNAGITALYGPVEGGTAYFKLPLAALVRQRGTDPKGWVEVEYDGKTGWVKKGNIELLSP